MKKFSLTGGILGAIIGILVSIYFAGQIQCIGLYANPDGTFGTTCANISIITVMQRNIVPELVTTLILIVIGTLVGLIIGKAMRKRHMVSQ